MPKHDNCTAHDWALVQRVLERENDAERHFYTQFTPLIQRIAARYAGGGKRELEDFVSLAFAFLIVGVRQTSTGELTRHIPRLRIWLNDPQGRLNGFISKCVNNYFCDLVRQTPPIIEESMSDQSVEDQANNRPDPHAGAEDERLFYQEKIDSVRIVWAQLSLPDRYILDMRYVQEMSDTAIAKQLGISESTARRRRLAAETSFEKLYAGRILTRLTTTRRKANDGS